MLSKSESQIVDRLRDGGADELTSYFMEQRKSLRDFIQKRMKLTVAARIDGSDILQEAFIAAHKQFRGYIANPTVSALFRLRKICHRTLLSNYVRHLDTGKRTVLRESPEYGDTNELQEEACASNRRAPRTPSSFAKENELSDIIAEKLQALSPSDRQIIELHHEQELSLREVADHLDIGYEAAKKRYRRAIQRLVKLFVADGFLND